MPYKVFCFRNDKKKIIGYKVGKKTVVKWATVEDMLLINIYQKNKLTNNYMLFKLAKLIKIYKKV